MLRIPQIMCIVKERCAWTYDFSLAGDKKANDELFIIIFIITNSLLQMLDEVNHDYLQKPV